VNSAVGSELGGLAEEAATAWHTTVERLFPGMDETVFLDVLLAGEALAAGLAEVGLDGEMGHVHVSA